jgi:hypothetical protein
VREEVDKDKLPSPWQKEDLTPVPDWWPDPPFSLRGWERFLRVEITEELKRVGKLRLTGHPGLTLEIMSDTGHVVASGIKADTGQGHTVEVDLIHVQSGPHIVRVGRDLPAAARLDPERSRAVAQFNLSPGW